MPEQDPQKLEAFVHRALRELPTHRAPASLEGRVFAALAARQQAPWWKSGWQAWPAFPRALVLGSGIAALVACAWLTWAGMQSAETISAGSWIAQHMPGLLTVRSFVLTLSSAVGSLITHYQTYLIGLLVLGAAAYITAIGIGTSLYRYLAVEPRR